MPKRKIIRDPVEEEAFKRAKLDKKNATQRLKRHNCKKQDPTRVIDLDRCETITLNASDVENNPSTSYENVDNHLDFAAIDDGAYNRGCIVKEKHVINEHYLGLMNFICRHCGAHHFSKEQVANKKDSFNDCCSHGEVALADLPQSPSVLKNLFDGSHEKSRQVYYQINESLYPESGDRPTNGQLFIIDAAEASQYRCDQNNKLDIDVVSSIESIIREHNIFVNSYEMMKDEINAEKSKDNNSEPELQLLFQLKKGMDRGRYNFQRVNEVAAVFSTTADGQIPESYVTIRNRTTKQLAYVSNMDPNVETWIYPLFYPYGTRGWDQNLTCVNKIKKRVSRNAYIKFRMALRNDFNVFLFGRRLFQQWVVDSYVKIEKDRINWNRDHQKELRAES
ncbi:uncharacterized protein LOC123270098 [Cotesia glomerata]|uniref:uncharacterized protein LOC123270098 n=1 Tax=Cotesia glomerata TaxID=32391 RepID=UPI001D016A93|nr:uncharacterized protein LOC123270098 [Cotesia glomerata]